MTMDWFRSHHGAPTDPKWRTIAKRAGVAPGTVVSIAWALLDAASQAGDRGSMASADLETLADFMGYEVGDVERVVAAMVDKGILAGDRFTAWERRQPKREDEGASTRKAAQRERERQDREDAKRQASPQGDLLDVPRGHEQSRPVTECHDRAEESRAEQNREEAGKPASAQAREPAARQPMSDAEFKAEALHVVAAWDKTVGPFKPMLELQGDRTRILAVMREVVATREKPVGSWKLWATDIVPERLAAAPKAAPARASPAPPADDGPKVNTPSGRLSVAYLLAEHEAGRWRSVFGKPPGDPACPIHDYLQPLQAAQ